MAINKVIYGGNNLLMNLINSYKGAAIIISHDEHFLKRIKEARVITMESLQTV